MIVDRMLKALGVCVYAACGAALLGVPVLAQPSMADDLDFYVEYSAGGSYVPNQRLVNANPSTVNIEGRTDGSFGFNFGGAIGKRVHENIRGELQLSYRQNEVDRMPIKAQRPPAQGNIGLLAIMANGYFDYDLGIGIVPYVGAGIGWGRLAVDVKNKSDFAGPLQTNVEGNDSVFAWALMIGGFYPISESIDLSLGYRYIATTDADVNSTIRDIGEGVIAPPPPNQTNPPLVNDPTTGVARRLKIEFDAHEAIVGLRFKF